MFKSSALLLLPVSAVTGSETFILPSLSLFAIPISGSSTPSLSTVPMPRLFTLSESKMPIPGLSAFLLLFMFAVPMPMSSALLSLSGSTIPISGFSALLFVFGLLLVLESSLLFPIYSSPQTPILVLGKQRLGH